MTKKLTERVAVKVEVPFWAYPTKKLNQKARAHIRKWVRDTIKENLMFIPLYVEKDKSGAFIEDSSGKSKIEIK